MPKWGIVPAGSSTDPCCCESEPCPSGDYPDILSANGPDGNRSGPDGPYTPLYRTYECGWFDYIGGASAPCGGPEPGPSYAYYLSLDWSPALGKFVLTETPVGCAPPTWPYPSGVVQKVWENDADPPNTPIGTYGPWVVTS
jgi:hypothetical protein